jgi:hypothetical protein
VRPRRREANAVTEQRRQYINHEPPPQALAGRVGAEDLRFFAARGAGCGDGFPDVTGDERRETVTPG